MGRVRNLNFDAVIGIGGIGHQAHSNAIDRKINWIGITPKMHSKTSRGRSVTFEHFYLYEKSGPDLQQAAPLLARRFFERNTRYVLINYSPEELVEANRILAQAKTYARFARKSPRNLTNPSLCNPPEIVPRCVRRC